MAALIKSRRITVDPWQLLKSAADPLPQDGDVIVPLSMWHAQRDVLLARSGRLGDGRGYSSGRLLRKRYGWQGELRAIGYVIRDYLFDLSRCGFDAFSLREGEDAHAALSGFDDFSDGYQISVDRPQPLFRRRVIARTTPA
jgi:uncharacterized protein (DUF934 family)